MPPSEPLVPGIPPLFQGISSAFAVVLLTRDLVSEFGGIVPQWGIFRGGAPVIIADNVVSLDYRQEWTVADYPVEDGGFASYDKVQLPFEARVRFSAGPTLLSQGGTNLLDSIAAIAGDFNLYEVRTPSRIYTNANIFHYDYRRTARNGATLIEVDIWLREVRITGLSTFGNTAQPSGADPINAGTVSAAPIAKVVQTPL